MSEYNTCMCTKFVEHLVNKAYEFYIGSEVSICTLYRVHCAITLWSQSRVSIITVCKACGYLVAGTRYVAHHRHQ